MLEGEARRRAVDGVRKYLYYQGVPITLTDPKTGEKYHAHEINYSDTLLMMLLKARDPEQFCERARLAKIMRRWAKDDAAKGEGGTVPAEAVIKMLQQLASQKAALA